MNTVFDPGLVAGDLTMDPPGPAYAALSSMPRIDLIPPEIQERRELRQFKVVLGGFVAASVLAVGGFTYLAHTHVSSARTSLASAQAGQSAEAAKVAALSPVTAVYTGIARAKSLVASAYSTDVRWSNYLRDLSLSMPDGIWLTAMAVSSGTPAAATSYLPSGIFQITFSGDAIATGAGAHAAEPLQGTLARNRVAAWLQALATEKGYESPYVGSTAETVDSGGTAIISFSSTVQVSSAALSGRYAANGS